MMMFIRLSKGKYTKDYVVYLVEGYYDERGKVKQRTLKSFGYLGELTKTNPNALEELKAWAKAATQTKDETEKILVELDLRARPNTALRNYGNVFLEAIYRALKIPEFMNEQQAKTEVEYSLDGILQLLTYSRCLNPASKKRTYEGKGNYFFDLPDFSLDDIYRSLSQLAAMKDNLTLHLHRQLSETAGRDCSLVFYDVTNYHFESDVTEGLRQKGVAKNHMDTGIVQMGLFIDNDGIPITYELFPGNTNDMTTMRPVLERIKREYDLGKITIVADKGNNTGDNLAYIDGEADHYIISQKIRGSGKEFIAVVLDEDGYVANADESFKWKAIERTREAKRRDGTIRKITEHLLCFWSAEEEQYQKAKRGLLDEKIGAFIEKPSLLNASNSFGIKKYFKKIVVDKQTGEILKAKEQFVFNQEKYERDLALDGYYCIVTNDLTLAPLDIIKHYHELSKIEESFRVTKSDLEGRPVYVWTDEHVQGHFLTCYLALVLYRLLQRKLENKYPIHQIKEALNGAVVLGMEKDIHLMQETSPIIKELMELHQIDFDYKYIRNETLRHALKKISSQ